ncbi:hypothetical protein ACQR5S_20015 [Xanthomonas oryzae pv. oryzicola]|uniref:hypothetical protein n=1 Tax=Xanthomonas oryzae TaxID=347 RepID=UPI003D17EE19
MAIFAGNSMLGDLWGRGHLTWIRAFPPVVAKQNQSINKWKERRAMMEVKQRKLLPIIFSVMAVFALSSGRAAEQDLEVPKIPKELPYAEVRKIMLGAGWSPYHSVEAEPCSPGDQRCQGRPELQQCADTGLGQCIWLWEKKGKRILILTQDSDLFVKAMSYGGA